MVWVPRIRRRVKGPWCPRRARHRHSLCGASVAAVLPTSSMTPTPTQPVRTASTSSDSSPYSDSAALRVAAANSTKVLEGECARRQRAVPDQPGTFPRVASERVRDEVERAIRNPGVDVYTTVVRRGLDVVIHMAGLRVTAEYVVVVCRSRGLEGAQRLALYLIRENLGADEPRRFRGRLPERTAP